jgi:mannose-6-phosphate isomerase-like protein (cupin superfamily)
VHIKAAVAPVFSQDGFTVKDLITSEQSSVFSLASVSVRGEHPPSENDLCDRAYYIINGSARISVGRETYSVSSGDAVMIPKGTTHAVSGDVDYVVINVPPFDPAHEKRPR